MRRTGDHTVLLFTDLARMRDKSSLSTFLENEEALNKHCRQLLVLACLQSLVSIALIIGMPLLSLALGESWEIEAGGYLVGIIGMLCAHQTLGERQLLIGLSALKDLLKKETQ